MTLTANGQYTLAYSDDKLTSIKWRIGGNTVNNRNFDHCVVSQDGTSIYYICQSWLYKYM